MNFRKRILLRAEFNRNVIFTAIMLNEADKSSLLRSFPPKHHLVQDGHITLQFRPGILPDNLGKEVNVQVFGYANDDKADAVAVKLFEVESKNEIPHITLSVREDTKPIYANELLKKGYEAVEPLMLKGRIAAFIGGQGYIFSLPEPEIKPTPPNPPLQTTPAQEIEKPSI
jgi:hypothetical protein